MKTFTIICGLNDKDTKTQLIDTDTAERIAAGYILTYADGATLTRCKGIYKHEDGQIVFENSLKIEICGITQENAERIANGLKKDLNQESIYFSVATAAVDFI